MSSLDPRGKSRRCGTLLHPSPLHYHTSELPCVVPKLCPCMNYIFLFELVYLGTGYALWMFWKHRKQLLYVEDAGLLFTTILFILYISILDGKYIDITITTCCIHIWNSFLVVKCTAPIDKRDPWVNNTSFSYTSIEQCKQSDKEKDCQLL